MAHLFTIDRVPLAGSQWRYGEKFIVTQNLIEHDYIVDLYDGNKFDLVLFAHTYLEIINIQNGEEYIFIFNRDPDSIASIGPVVYLFFSSDLPIKWHGLTEENVSVELNAKIKLYKSEGVIYAELIKPFIGNSGS